jgi:hypothetical protein
MSESKAKLQHRHYYNNPFFNLTNIADFYDDTRDDQVDESDAFVNLTQNNINQNIYNAYKSFFYRYQDYNQINR